MRIRKYDVNWSRRELMKKMAMGAAGAGVLGSYSNLWAMDGLDDITKIYPDELLSVEAQTKGKISVGDVITPDNLHHAEHLLDPGRPVVQSGRQGVDVPPGFGSPPPGRHPADPLGSDRPEHVEAPGKSRDLPGALLVVERGVDPRTPRFSGVCSAN